MGLLDQFVDPTGNPTPLGAGLLGALAAGGAANPPQAASRLPLAKPSPLYILSQEAGGYLGGAQNAAKNNADIGGIKAQTAGQNLQNLNALQNYNLTAPWFGMSPISMDDLQAGRFDPKTMAMSQVVNGVTGGQSGQGSAPPSGGGLLGSIGSGIKSLFGGSDEAGPTPAAPAPQPQPQSQVDQPPSSYASVMGGAQPAGLLGNPAPTAPQGGLLSSGSGMPTAANPVAQARLNQLLFGASLTPVQKAIVAQGGNPFDPQYQSLLQNETIKASGVDPYIHERGQPIQHWNPESNGYIPQPGQYDVLRNSAAATSQGNLPAELTKIGAQGAETRRNQANQAELDTGVPNAGVGRASSGAGAQAQGAVTTTKGTQVPTPQGNQTEGRGTQEIGKMLSNSQDMQKSWQEVRPTLEGTESRLMLLADSLKQVQGKGLNEAKAQVAATMQGLGVPQSIIDSTVMSAKDMSAVQQAIGAQTLDVLGQLKQINQGTGGKILNSEFVNLLDKQYGPNMSPDANFSLITQALGGIDQAKNMIDDYNGTGRQQGWRYADQFQSAYYQKNPYADFVKAAGEKVGPLKGMGAGAPLSDPMRIRR